MSKKVAPFQVKWTPIAIESFEAISLQIIERWNMKMAILFDQQVESAIDQIVVNPKIYPVSAKNKLRKCIIHKNTSLIYRINKSVVELIVFVDNRSEHGF